MCVPVLGHTSESVYVCNSFAEWQSHRPVPGARDLCDWSLKAVCSSVHCSVGVPGDRMGLPRSGWSGCQWHSSGFPFPQNARVLAWRTQRQPVSNPHCPGSPPTESHQQSSQWVFLLPRTIVQFFTTSCFQKSLTCCSSRLNVFFFF